MMSAIDAWERFLRSLETDGGRLVVLVAMLLCLLFIVIWMFATGHSPAETGKILLASAISSMLAILFGYLSKRNH